MSLNFVKMTTALHQNRYLRQMQNLVWAKVPCGIFSGITLPKKFTEMVQQLRNLGINLNCVIALDDEIKTSLSNVEMPVYTLSDISKGVGNVRVIFYEDTFVNEAFTNFFSRYGIQSFPIANLGGKEGEYNFYVEHLSELYNTHEMFADEESKAVFRAYVTGKVTGKISDYKFAPESQYFLEGFLPGEGDIAIDGGAYDGATSRDFAMQGAKVYAFEMSAQNYKNCLDRAEKYNFVIENIGLSNQEGVEHYSGGGAGARRGGGVWKLENSSTLILTF